MRACVARGRVVVFPGLLTLTFGSKKVALVNKPAFLRYTHRSDHPEVKKAYFLDFKLDLNRAFYFGDHVINVSSFSCMMIITKCRAALTEVAALLASYLDGISTTTSYL